eukprot:TRINITY_DN11622_c0_g1_i14.p1 TRINITY_DN11622_c0_g1~~TRINITY_DN11622_c0_g1_i14.p1  ORF type:complete len:297 (-),score=61.25 TRINITY_DN11622_c0_g1_i14:436-1326(-)
MAYLNDDFEGGETKFYETDASQNISPTTKRTHKEPPSYILKLAMKAKTGNVIVFNHDALHEGTPLVSGIKYIFRTDMIFQRISFSLTDTLHFLKDPEYHEAEKHYQNSIRLKCEGGSSGINAEYGGHKVQPSLHLIDWCRASHWTEVSNDEGFFPLYFFDLLSRESPPNDFMNVSSDNHDVIPKIVSILRSALDPKIFLNREEAKKVLVLTGGRSFFFEKAISEFLSEWNSDTKLILPEKEARSVLKLRGAKKMIINEGKQLMSFKKLVNHSDAGYREPRSLPENPLQPKKRCAMM